MDGTTHLCPNINCSLLTKWPPGEDDQYRCDARNCLPFFQEGYSSRYWYVCLLISSRVSGLDNSNKDHGAMRKWKQIISKKKKTSLFGHWTYMPTYIEYIAARTIARILYWNVFISRSRKIHFLIDKKHIHELSKLNYCAFPPARDKIPY